MDSVVPEIITLQYLIDIEVLCSLNIHDLQYVCVDRAL